MRMQNWAGSGLAVGALMVLALGGCKSKQNAVSSTGNAAVPPAATPAPAESASGAPATAPGTTPSSATLADPQIAQIALTANSGDSARGKIAEQKATNPQVKAFAREMVTDHSGLNKKAVALAKKLNVTPQQSAADSDLVSKVTSMNNDLQGKTGKDFDKTYMDQEVQIHQLVLDDLDKNLIPAAQNADLKQLLQTARGVVQGHLQKAQQIQGTLK